MVKRVPNDLVHSVWVRIINNCGLAQGGVGAQAAEGLIKAELDLLLQQYLV